jgi:hypothetical protein
MDLLLKARVQELSATIETIFMTPGQDTTHEQSDMTNQAHDVQPLLSFAHTLLYPYPQ